MRILEFYQCSILSFNYGTTERRVPQRPVELRQPSFDKDFDYNVIFADVLRDYKTNKVYAIGAPLEHSNIPLSCSFNFLKAEENIGDIQNSSLYSKNFVINFFKKFFSNKNKDNHSTYGNWFERCQDLNCGVKIEKLDRLWRYSWDNIQRDSQILKSTMNGDVHFNNINSNFSWTQLCKNKNIVFLKNCNNRLQWIKDYCNYYKNIHHGDIFLIYDSSTDYSSLELLEFLKDNTDVSVIVVSWPLPFGPTRFKNSFWDSDFSLYMCLEHAKKVFSQEAKAFLYADIDELVVSKSNSSVFDAVNSLDCDLPILMYSGIMVDFDLPLNNYSTFSFKDMSKINTTIPRAVVKWVVKINQVTLSDNFQWRVHNFYDVKDKKTLGNALSSDFETRHFIGITSGWRRKNLVSKLSPNPECPLLKRNYKYLGWIDSN